VTHNHAPQPKHETPLSRFLDEIPWPKELAIEELLRRRSGALSVEGDAHTGQASAATSAWELTPLRNGESCLSKPEQTVRYGGHPICMPSTRGLHEIYRGVGPETRGYDGANRRFTRRSEPRPDPRVRHGTVENARPTGLRSAMVSPNAGSPCVANTSSRAMAADAAAGGA